MGRLRLRRALPAALGALAACAAPAFAAPEPQVHVAWTRVRLAPGGITGAVVSCTLPAGWSFVDVRTNPSAPGTTNDVQVSPGTVTSNRAADGSWRVQAPFALQVFEVDDLLFPSFGVRLRDPSGASRALVLAPVRLQLDAPAVDTKRQPPIRGAKGPFDDGELFPWWWVALGGLAVGAAAAWFILRRRRARGPVEEAPLDPLAWAHERLAALDERPCADEEEIKEYYIELTMVMRRYLGWRTGLPFAESTTGEAEALLAGVPWLAGFARAGFRQWLAEGDLVKFARLVPPPDARTAYRAACGAWLDGAEHAYQDELEARERERLAGAGGILKDGEGQA